MLLIYDVTPSNIQHSAAKPRFGVVTDCSRAKVLENQTVMFLTSSSVLLHFCYTTPSQAEVYGEPLWRYLTEDEDEREPMFIQPHDPDYVSEPIYPVYIPLEDEHVFPVEEQPLPPVDSPTAESPGYVAESDPEEDPEEYEDDETAFITTPFNDITTTGARITVWLQAFISLPPEAERLVGARPLLQHSSTTCAITHYYHSSGCQPKLDNQDTITRLLIDAVTAAPGMRSGRVLLLDLPEIEGLIMGLSAPWMLKRVTKGLVRWGMVLGY
ncbi:hypothetical protein Tco_0098051 [Tanacetum coccineum]